jgi:peptidoglycan hydrolase CwlO-like protein
VDTQTVALIGVLCTLLGTLIGFLTFTRNRDKDVRNDASRNAVIETKLDNINQSVNSIAVKLEASERRWAETGKEVVRLDESLKSAHKRIDALEKKEEN